MDHFSDRHNRPARAAARELNEQLTANLRRAFPVDGFAVDGAASFAGLLRALDEQRR
jgi:hypothetical protein